MVFPSVLVIVHGRDFPVFDNLVHSWNMDVVQVDIFGRPGFAFFDTVEGDQALDILFKARIHFTLFKESNFEGGNPPVPHNTPDKDVPEEQQPPVGEAPAS
jgi:hypothetical protein